MGIADGLTKHFKFDNNLENELNPLDLALLQGAAAFTIDMDGEPNYAVNTTAGYTEITSDLILSDSYSVSFWCKPIGLGNGKIIQVAATNSSGSPDLMMDYTNLWTGTGYLSISSIAGGSWTHIALTVQTVGGNVKVYVNGSIHGTVTKQTDQDRSKIFLGDGYPGASYGTTAVDELRVYDRVITAAEALEIYNLGVEPEFLISLNRTTATLKPYNQLRLIATTIPIDAEVTWTTSNSRAATVDYEGLVEVYSRGTATITATITGASATCEITIGGKMSQSSGLYALTLTRTSDSAEHIIASTPQDAAFEFVMPQTVQSFFTNAAGGLPTEGRVVLGTPTLTVDLINTTELMQFLSSAKYSDSATKTSFGTGHGCTSETFEVVAHPLCAAEGDKEDDIKFLKAVVEVTDSQAATIDGKKLIKCVFTAMSKDVTLGAADAITLTAGSGGALALYWIFYATNATGKAVGTAELQSTVDDDQVNFTLPKGATGGTFYAGTATGPATALKYHQVTSADISTGYIVTTIYNSSMTSATVLPTVFEATYPAGVERGA